VDAHDLTDLAAAHYEGRAYGPSSSVRKLLGVSATQVDRLRAAGALPVIARSAHPAVFDAVKGNRGSPPQYLYDLVAAAERVKERAVERSLPSDQATAPRSDSARAPNVFDQAIVDAGVSGERLDRLATLEVIVRRQRLVDEHRQEIERHHSEIEAQYREIQELLLGPSRVPGG
jgi:hypothetical protein